MGRPETKRGLLGVCLDPGACTEPRSRGQRQKEAAPSLRRAIRTIMIGRRRLCSRSESEPAARNATGATLLRPAKSPVLVRRHERQRRQRPECTAAQVNRRQMRPAAGPFVGAPVNQFRRRRELASRKVAALPVEIEARGRTARSLFHLCFCALSRRLYATAKFARGNWLFFRALLQRSAQSPGLRARMRVPVRSNATTLQSHFVRVPSRSDVKTAEYVRDSGFTDNRRSRRGG